MDDDQKRRPVLSYEEFARGEISWDDAMKGDPEQPGLEVGPTSSRFPSVAEGAKQIAAAEHAHAPVAAEELVRKLVEDDARRRAAKDHWARALLAEKHAIAARDEGRDDLYQSFKEQAALQRSEALKADPEFAEKVREAGVKMGDA